MKKIKIGFIIIVMLSLTSCDCVQNASGLVIDAKSNHPISNVSVHKENKEHDKDITNDKGEFEVRSISGGPFGCPSMTVVITKEGYESRKVEIKNSDNIILKLKKI